MIVPFPVEHQPHVEILRVRDRFDGRTIYIFDYVGRDDSGPFRIDMAHRYTLGDVADEVAYWWQQGIEVDGSAVLA